MKKFFVIATMIVASLGINAQEEAPKYEVAIAYGVGCNTDLIGSLYKGIFTGKQLDYWGPVSAEFFYRPTKKLGVGVVGGVGGCKWDDTGDAKSTFVSIMPAVKYNWLNKDKFSMYSKAAVGITIVSDKGLDKDKSSDSSTSFNFQASFVGLEYGTSLRAFAEFGVGEQGMALAGIRYKF